VRDIKVDREGIKVYPLQPSINRVTHRLVCEVRFEEGLKVITIRSTYLFKNSTAVAIELGLYDPATKKFKQTWKVPANGSAPVPIEGCYDSRVKVRPAGNASGPFFFSVLRLLDD
jgi:vacuolar protein sorting-associated protein 13A/C